MVLYPPWHPAQQLHGLPFVLRDDRLAAAQSLSGAHLRVVEVRLALVELRGAVEVRLSERRHDGEVAAHRASRFVMADSQVALCSQEADEEAVGHILISAIPHAR